MTEDTKRNKVLSRKEIVDLIRNTHIKTIYPKGWREGWYSDNSDIIDKEWREICPLFFDRSSFPNMTYEDGDK